MSKIWNGTGWQKPPGYRWNCRRIWNCCGASRPMRSTAFWRTASKKTSGAFSDTSKIRKDSGIPFKITGTWPKGSTGICQTAWFAGPGVWKPPTTKLWRSKRPGRMRHSMRCSSNVRRNCNTSPLNWTVFWSVPVKTKPNWSGRGRTCITVWPPTQSATQRERLRSCSSVRWRSRTYHSLRWNLTRKPRLSGKTGGFGIVAAPRK